MAIAMKLGGYQPSASLDGELGDLFARRMEGATPFRVLGLWDNGFRHLTNTVRPSRRPEDCRGLRIRTQGHALHGEVFQALGFEPLAVDIKRFVEKIAGRSTRRSSRSSPAPRDAAVLTPARPRVYEGP